MAQITELDELRGEIDAIDSELLSLFERRMAAARAVGKVKRDNNLPIMDAKRETAILDRLTGGAEETRRTEISLFMRNLFTLSRMSQRSEVYHEETGLLPPPRPAEDGAVSCVYQGVPGAWGELALLTAFPDAQYSGLERFEDVFLAVRDGKARYGVVPIDNSTTGAIGETYDLLRKYNCYIVGKTEIAIRQCLLAKEGAKLGDIRSVASHPEALKQCGRFLRAHSWDVDACRNTAVAAKIAAEDESGRVAAIASRRAAEAYGLNVLAPDIMDSAKNSTSFIVIADRPEYDETSKYITINFSTSHSHGALCQCLMPFMTMGINMCRLESRPTTGGNYRFYTELEGNIMDENVQLALKQIAATAEYFEVLGCYNLKGRG